jgi:hypothetical protein
MSILAIRTTGIWPSWLVTKIWHDTLLEETISCYISFLDFPFYTLGEAFVHRLVPKRCLGAAFSNSVFYPASCPDVPPIETKFSLNVLPTPILHATASRDTTVCAI